MSLDNNLGRREWVFAAATTFWLNGLLCVRPSHAGDEKAKKDDESKLWDAQKAKAKAAFAFWETLLALRSGPKNDEALNDNCHGHFLCIIRAVSWVESKHGTVGKNHPKEDPFQCGNPMDVWWKQLTNQSEEQDRIVGGPGAGNYFPKDLPNAVKNEATFPKEAKLSQLASPEKGHNDAMFNSTMSYSWGVLYLVHRINTHKDLGADKRTYKCGDCSMARMTNGAVAYNGGGDPSYGEKIAQALKLIGCS